MTEHIYSIAYFIKKILFPSKCLVCKKGTDTLCVNCLATLTKIPRVLKRENCTEITFFHYQQKSIAKIIWELKYKNNRELRQKIMHYIALDLQKELSYVLPNVPNIYCISIPKTKNDAKKRDFDHGYLLVQEFQKYLPYQSELLKDYLLKKSTLRQVEHTKRADRIEKIKNTIIPTQKFTLLQKTLFPLIIVDDVTTTGATRDEMIRVLKPKFAGPIIFIALAH
jgi:predicted amidophosphoribosyltransferase